MSPENGNGGAPSSGTLSPMSVLDAARKAVPAVDYALGAAGVAAAGAIVVAFLGNGRGAIIIFGGMLVAMILLFVFSRLLTAQNAQIIQAAVALMWMVVVFFGIFLLFTTTAFALHWPLAWAQVLGIELRDDFDKKAMEKLLEVPKEVSNLLIKSDFRPPLEAVRLQPRLADAVVSAKREVAIHGGGAYYSFVSRSYESDSPDIALQPGLFRTGFSGADYGFFMYVGQGTLDEFSRLKLDAPPEGLEQSRVDAWKYMSTYKPPTDIKAVRGEQKRTQGFAVGAVSLSDQATVTKNGVYLLRSILFRRSDALVGFLVVDSLSDNSVVLVWRMLRIFDTPITMGSEN